LIKIRAATAPAGIELACERREGALRGSRLNVRKLKVEEVACERLALIVDGMAPGVGDLKLLAAGAVARDRGERVVIGGALARSPGDIGQSIIKAMRAQAIRAVHDVGGDQLAAERAESVHFDGPTLLDLLLHAEEEALHVGVAQARIEQCQVRE